MSDKKKANVKAHDNGAGPIYIGRGKSSIGPVLIAFTSQGMCALRLDDGTPPDKALKDLKRHFPRRRLEENGPASRPYLAMVDRVLAGRLDAGRVPLDPRGTAFQQKVWRTMLRIPHGRTCSYQELAAKVGKPRAVRAVASACARNPIALIVPCHRVLRSDGSLGGYYYGLKKKQEILRFEASHS